MRGSNVGPEGQHPRRARVVAERGDAAAEELSDATERLAGEPAIGDALRLFDRDFLTRFTHGSAAIEGSALTPIQTELVLEGEFLPRDHAQLSDMLAARGIAEGYEYARRSLDESRPLSAELIKDMHEWTALDCQPAVRGSFFSTRPRSTRCPLRPLGASFPSNRAPTALTLGSRCRIRCPCPLRLVRLPPRLRTKGQAGADPGRLRPDARRARVGRHHSSDLPRPGGPSGRPLPGAVSRRSAPSRTRPASASRRQRQPGKGNYWVEGSRALGRTTENVRWDVCRIG